MFTPILGVKIKPMLLLHLGVNIGKVILLRLGVNIKLALLLCLGIKIEDKLCLHLGANWPCLQQADNAVQLLSTGNISKCPTDVVRSFSSTTFPVSC